MQRLGHRAVEILDEAVVGAETVRTNKVTQKQVAQLKKVAEGLCDTAAFMIWPRVMTVLNVMHMHHREKRPELAFYACQAL
jgi:hypothetical protein